MITKKIKLKTWETNYIVLYANQGEINSRFIEITFDTQNQSLDLTGKTVTIYAMKPDGNLIYNDCIISDVASGIITVELTSQMSAVPGLVICELHIFNENGCLLKVKGLQIMIIHSDDFSSAIQSTSQYSTLINSINKAENLVNQYSSQIGSGTWNPVLSSLEGTPPTYTTEYYNASWYRISDLIFISFHMKCNITSAGTDYACVDGLPFTAKNGVDGQALATRESFGSIGSSTGSIGIVEDNTTRLRIANLSGDTKQQWKAGTVWVGYTGCYIKAKSNFKP